MRALSKTGELPMRPRHVFFASLVLLVGLFAVGPVSSADDGPRSQPPEMPRLNLITETFELLGGTVVHADDGFPADTPFFIHHGWGASHETSGGYGSGWDMLVFIELGDGTRILSSPDYKLRTGKELCGFDAPDQCFSFVHEFPDGLPPGTHTIQGWWYAACEDWISGGAVDECDDPKQRFSPGPLVQLTVEFVSHPLVLQRFWASGDPFEAGEPLADALLEATGAAFYVVAADDAVDMYNELCSAPQPALAVVPTAIYALASEDCEVDASFKAERFGADHSKSQFLVHTDSEATGLADLEGLNWAFSSLTSYSGYMVPLGMLNEAAVQAVPLDPVATHVAAAQAVHAGTADFATTFVSPSLEGLDVKVLIESDEIPNDAVAFGAEFPEDLRIEVEAFLWGDGRDTLLQSMDTLYPPWGWGDIVEADDADWDWFRDILSWAGIGIGDL